jgi:hypothetical protein
MRTAFWWIVGAIAATVLFVGIPAAASLTNTAAGTTGSTGGLVIGGIPTFVGSFKNGMSYSNGVNGNQDHNGLGSGASWSGGVQNWGGTTQAPRQQKRQTAPARQRAAHPKPNA